MSNIEPHMCELISAIAPVFDCFFNEAIWLSDLLASAQGSACKGLPVDRRAKISTQFHLDDHDAVNTVLKANFS